MNILIVSGAFFPTNSPRSFRTTELVKELYRLGHKVTLYIPKTAYNYTSFLKDFQIDIKFYNRVQEKRSFLGISILDRVIFRFLNQFCAYPTLNSYPILTKALEEEKGYDILVTIAVPHSIPWAFGKLYAKGIRAAKTWISDCGDPFMFEQSGNFRPPFYLKKLETRWCKYCDYISVPTETSYLGYYPEFREKIRVIPQGFDFDAVKMSEYKKNPIPTFAYAGSFIPGKRDPRRLFEFLSTIQKPFKFIVYGTSDKSRWQDLLSKLEGKVIFEQPIPRSELLPKLSQMDFLINIGNGTSVQTPSKLIDYSLTKRPILTIETTDIKEDVLGECLAGDYQHCDEKIDISRYDIHNVAQQFLALCR